MHKYKICYLDGSITTVEDAELGLNFPTSAVFKIKGEIKLIIPYSAIKYVEKLD